MWSYGGKEPTARITSYVEGKPPVAQLAKRHQYLPSAFSIQPKKENRKQNRK